MIMDNMTIYAPATAKGIGGVAVIRISGNRAREILETLTKKPIPKARCASLQKLFDPKTKKLLDDALTLYFKAPNSFTGEDIVELHIHGGHAVMDSVLSALSGFEGTRLALPGEFTRRGFENGKFDLTQAEAINDLIHAETKLQAEQALRQSGGALTNLYDRWMSRLSKSLAHIEADIEFPDEDLPDEAGSAVIPEINIILEEIKNHLDDNKRGERLRDGFHISLIGAPNAGKSSLLNMLAAREAAIVSDIAGTTRDIIDVHLDLKGYPLIISDTAGLRKTSDNIEIEGISRAKMNAEKADLILAVFDASHERADSHTLDMIDENSLIIANKEDLGISASWKNSLNSKINNNIFELSLKNKIGIDELLEGIFDKIEKLYGIKESPSLTQKRHRESLVNAKNSIERSLDAPLPELMAEDIRLAVRALGSITGKIDIEELLDIIFKDFCIGK